MLTLLTHYWLCGLIACYVAHRTLTDCTIRTRVPHCSLTDCTIRTRSLTGVVHAFEKAATLILRQELSVLHKVLSALLSEKTKVRALCESERATKEKKVSLDV